MLGFRYHALSLVAVFLALGLGILLGVNLGDSVVERADAGLRSSLRQDLIDARAQAREGREAVDDRDRLIASAVPALAENRLRGERIALVSVGPIPEEVESSVRQAVDVAGGRIDSMSTLPPVGEIETLGQALGGRYAQAPDDERVLRSLGRTVARAVLGEDRAVRRLGRAAEERFRGDFRGADAVVVYRSPPASDTPPDPQADAPADPQAEARAATVEEAMFELLREEGARVVGVEELAAQESQVPFYADRRVTTVDNVDQPGGQAALVLALDGAEGRFGYKEGADAPLPELANESATRP